MKKLFIFLLFFLWMKPSRAMDSDFAIKLIGHPPKCQMCYEKIDKINNETLNLKNVLSNVPEEKSANSYASYLKAILIPFDDSDVFHENTIERLTFIHFLVESFLISQLKIGIHIDPALHAQRVMCQLNKARNHPLEFLKMIGLMKEKHVLYTFARDSIENGGLGMVAPMRETLLEEQAYKEWKKNRWEILIKDNDQLINEIIGNLI